MRALPAGRQGRRQLRHQRAAREDLVDPRRLHLGRKIGMKAGCLGPELEHVAEGGEPTAGHRAENGERGSHGGRIGVVAFVDERHRAARDGKAATLAPTGKRLESPETRGQRRRIELQRVADGEHRQRVHHPVPTRQRYLEADTVAAPHGEDVAAVGPEVGIDETPVGVQMGTESQDAPRAGPLRAGEEPRELLAVAWQNRDTARLEAREDLGLGVGDRLDRAQELEMGGRYPGNGGDVRPDLPRERLDLTRVVHAHLEDAKARLPGQAGQGQRNAPMIVVAGRAAVCRAGAGQDVA